MYERGETDAAGLCVPNENRCFKRGRRRAFKFADEFTRLFQGQK